MHVTSGTLREAVSVRLPQGVDSRIAVLVADFTVVVAAAVIEPGVTRFLRRSTHSWFQSPHEQPVVLPQVSHFMQVPLRTRVKFPHSPQASPS